VSIEELWPDPDRRDDALLRCAIDVASDDHEALTPGQRKVLEAVSHGLGNQGAADALGLSIDSVKTQLQLASRSLAAKNATHACCIALRRGLIN
jgi:DNA-binding NarL/FixJ family response regulator